MVVQTVRLATLTAAAPGQCRAGRQVEHGEFHPAAVLLISISFYALGFSMGLGFQHVLAPAAEPTRGVAPSPPVAQKILPLNRKADP